MEFLPYLLAVVIGIIMGLIGGGGSILCVPIFVYIFGFSSEAAVANSLFVVGIMSIFGSFGYFRQGLVDFKTVFLFGIPSLFSIFFVRKIILPNIPPVIAHLNGFEIKKDFFLLLLFAILMLGASIKMITSKPKTPHITHRPQYTLLITQGISVGMITGLIGAGGGFLIVPALVMLLGLDIKKAIGTSLVIVSLNSLLGFFSSIDLHSDWDFLILFTSLSVVGIVIGLQFSKKINGERLKPIFGYFVLVIGIYIIIKETIFKS